MGGGKFMSKCFFSMHENVRKKRENWRRTHLDTQEIRPEAEVDRYKARKENRNAKHFLMFDQAISSASCKFTK